MEIRQYQTLLEILDKSRYGVRVLFALLIVVMVIFMALAFTTIAIKRIYPNNEIKTNAFVILCGSIIAISTLFALLVLSHKGYKSLSRLVRGR